MSGAMMQSYAISRKAFHCIFSQLLILALAIGNLTSQSVGYDSQLTVVMAATLVDRVPRPVRPPIEKQQRADPALVCIVAMTANRHHFPLRGNPPGMYSPPIRCRCRRLSWPCGSHHCGHKAHLRGSAVAERTGPVSR